MLLQSIILLLVILQVLIYFTKPHLLILLKLILCNLKLKSKQIFVFKDDKYQNIMLLKVMSKK